MTKNVDSKWEPCQICRKVKKINHEKRDPLTNGLSCSKCHKKMNGSPLLIYLIWENFGLEIDDNLHCEIIQFVRGNRRDQYDESDLKRIGVKEVLVYPKPRNPEERRFYCPLTQLQMRLCPFPNLYSIRRISIKNAYRSSKGGLIQKNPQTRSERFARTYFFLCTKQNQVDKKLKKDELKKHRFHQENLQLLKEFGKKDGIKKISEIRKVSSREKREKQNKYWKSRQKRMEKEDEKKRKFWEEDPAWRKKRAQRKKREAEEWKINKKKFEAWERKQKKPEKDEQKKGKEKKIRKIKRGEKKKKQSRKRKREPEKKQQKKKRKEKK